MLKNYIWYCLVILMLQSIWFRSIWQSCITGCMPKMKLGHCHVLPRPLPNWHEVMVNKFCWTPVKKCFFDLNNNKFSLLGSCSLRPLKLLAKLCANQVKLMANLPKIFGCHGIWRQVPKCWIEICVTVTGAPQTNQNSTVSLIIYSLWQLILPQKSVEKSSI